MRKTDQRMIDDCKRLYIAHQGRHHEQIEEEMRALGHTTFSRRCLYTRTYKDRPRPGLPELYGWDTELRRNADTSVRVRRGRRMSVPGTVVTGAFDAQRQLARSARRNFQQWLKSVS